LSDLDGNIAIVMNVKKFVGLATAVSLARAGAKVVCHDDSFSDDEELKSFSMSYPDLFPSAKQQPLSLVEATTEQFGQIDILVSNDAFPALRRKVEDCDLENLQKGIQSLVIEPYKAIAAVTPLMKTQNRGKVILVTSAAPIRGLANYSMYATARGATNALAVSLSRELAQNNIKVNAVAPNYIESPSYFPAALLADNSVKNKILSNIPLGRLGKPEEVASIITFLASQGGDFITGQIIPVDGGWS